MTNSNPPAVVADEKAAQKRYAKKVHAKLDRPVTVAGPRNTQFTGTGSTARPPATGTHLLGRVALTKADSLLNQRNDFYIGETFCSDLDGVAVFSWAAPVACTFFRGSDHHEYCDDVTVVRTFLHRAGEIVNYTDEVLKLAGSAPFMQRELKVPAAPKRLTIPPSPGRSRPAPSSPEVRVTAGSSLEESTLHSGEGTTPRIVSAGIVPIRAEDLLRNSLRAPRSKTLTSVLSTLQPDQYDLVSLPPNMSRIIEGQPGTGKTIVAAHRTAFMIDEQAPTSKLMTGDVLVVGPTAGYSNHVRGLIDSLTGNSKRVRVLAMPELVRDILGDREQLRGPASMTWQDVDAKLGMLVRSTILRLKRTSLSVPTLGGIYEQLRVEAPSLTKDVEWAGYLRRLPPFEKARTLRAHTALLAFIQWEVRKPRELGRIQHIIVDEAQDVTPLEWFLLQAINTANAWTILGDLNQRRSDHTSASWTHILDTLGLSVEEAPVSTLERGYRSTRPILDLANKLLPRTERRSIAFQADGPLPRIKKSRQNQFGEDVVSEVDRLLQAHSSGTLAVITVDPNRVRSVLRAAKWAVHHKDYKTMERSNRQISVLHPDDARGLEFDAVIVAEPTDFPENYGRQGPLYTALTRPNRELSIVHTKALPVGLRLR